MMDAEGHHQGGRAKTPNKERRGIEPFERIRMKGITSISVGGMVLHQPRHRVGQKSAEGDSVAFGGLSDGGKESADDTTHEIEGHGAVRLEIVKLVEEGAEAAVQQGGDVGVVLVLGGKRGERGEETVGVGLRIETVKELAVGHAITIMEHGS